jgi:hypothetical protein
MEITDDKRIQLEIKILNTVDRLEKEKLVKELRSMERIKEIRDGGDVKLYETTKKKIQKIAKDLDTNLTQEETDLMLDIYLKELDERINKITIY